MSKKSVLKMSALAVAFAAAAAPITAAAEVTGSLGISNFYLWRGQDLSNGGAVVSGSLDYSHGSGAYAGVWTSSETVFGTGAGGEYDAYLGFAGEAGGLSYDLSYVSYMYPGIDQGFGEQGEFILGLGLGDFGLTYYTSVYKFPGTDLEIGDDDYLTLSYAYDKFGFMVGTWMLDAADSDYTHVDISYSPVENLTFTASKIVAADDLAATASAPAFTPADEQDVLINVGYAFSF
ncbi:MAG: TorF family putative porin [Alcanivoracaceae bacterium]|nr:TorF family putative porin [Alcanivoracaceae bacterium]